MFPVLHRTSILLAALMGCASNAPAPPPLGHGGTVKERFPPPAGFERDSLATAPFAAYLRQLPLLPTGTPVHLYNGGLKARQDVHAAVVDMSVGATDLQQCADAVMRLRAEHLFAQGRYDEIHFNLTNGFRADFHRWMKGQRIQVNGPHGTQWIASAGPSCTHADLMAYLQQVFTYAGSLSLSRELRAPPNGEVQAGDVFIHGGTPGHAMIVVDVCHDATGRQAFLLAQSYMPAQQIHLVQNLRHPELGAWFIAGDEDRLYTPEWTFRWNERACW